MALWAPFSRAAAPRGGISTLAALSWLVPSVSIAIGMSLSRDPIRVLLHEIDAPATRVLDVAMPVFFLLLCARLVIAMLGSPARRAALAALLAAICLWAVGATELNSIGPPSTIAFPAPGEWFFLAACAGIASFILLDVPGRSRASLTTWLDASVVCGGAICLAGVLVATPVAADFSRQGVPLLVALLYPMLDLSLLVLVLGQVVLGSRDLNRSTALLLGGLSALGAADTSIVVNLSAQTYKYGGLLELTWTLSFLLLVASACRPSTPPEQVTRKVISNGFLTAAAAFVAVAVLAVPTGAATRSLLTLPAVVTLIAAGGRLILALRQANDAAEAYRLSLTDDLTGLPNRRALTGYVSRELEAGRPVALMLLDLDGFKDVNDTLGHAAGDAMLQIVASRLVDAVTDGVLVARLGGDEFALVYGMTGELELLEAAHHVRMMVRRPAIVDGLELTVDSSIGVAISTAETLRPGDLLRRADVAMYQAKNARTGSLIYDSLRDDFSRGRLQLAEQLRRGIAAGQLELWYQPQVSAANRAVVSVEALVRWRHPTQGLMPPGVFLNVARRAGLMPALTQETIRMAIGDAAGWRDRGIDVKVAINVAPSELMSAPVMETLLTLIREADLPPDHLIVEVTEESFLSEPERARQVITDLRAGGLQISIDDYGTGFSSLSYIRDLPLQELKIDRSFVSELGPDARSQMIVATTIGLAQGLGLRTVAEGVESAEIAELLVELGVDLLQGFHIARPMPGAEISTWIARHDALRLQPRAATP